MALLFVTATPLAGGGAVLAGETKGTQGEPGSQPPAHATEIRWSFSGEARFRPEWRDNADLDNAVDDDVRQGFMRLRVGVTAAIGDDYRLFFQAQDSRVAGEESASAGTATATSEKNLDLHQGYLDAALGAKKDLHLILGRQEWSYGDHRLIGNFGWNNIGRAFDGAKFRWTRPRFFLDCFVARITNQITSVPPPSAGIAGSQASTGSELYGVYAQAAPRKGAEYEGYWLAFADHAEAAGETGPLGRTLVNAIGGRAKDRFGGFDFTAEAVAESGEINGNDLSATAAGAQAGWTWGDVLKVRLFAGYDFATGDKDPADGRREEFFNFFPTNHPHYGYMDYEGWRNIQSPYAGVGLTRGRHFAQAKAHSFALDEARGPWKDAAGNILGFDPAGASGRNVGREYDLTYRFAWKEKASIEAGFSRFTPGRFARLTRGPDASDWAYVMLTVGF